MSNDLVGSPVLGSLAASGGLVAAVNGAIPSIPRPETRIVFFCKDCEKIVVGVKVGGKYVYKCPLCGTKNVAFGTEKSIRSFYRVKD